MNDEQIKELYQALEDSSFTVTITGAGISIAAGGVTYSGMRSRGARRGMRSDDPEAMYQYFYQAFLSSMFEHGPTYAHKALARLEEMGKMQGIITTNVDCLHTMGGSKNVAEIQGSFQTNVCTGCGAWTYGYEIWNHGKMPTCEKCGSTLLPYNIYSHAGLLTSQLQKAQKWIQQADLILIIGANGSYTHMYWDYKKPDAGIIQINPGSTYFDRVADLNIREESDPVFEALMKME
ncbi:MAG: hypothetical protein LIO56_02860 [Lachnospiraceae bacterium]|nr:hypothetical protein [Lachnospiraceae bacterium]